MFTHNLTQNKQKITEIKTINEFLKKCSFNSLIIFDLDNTVFEPVLEIGSNQWVMHLFNHASQMILDNDEACNLVFSIYYAIQNHIQMKAVEPNIVRIIQILNDIGFQVLALTSRGHQIIDATLNQLNELGIAFSNKQSQESFELPVISDKKVMFNQGIIFCSGEHKGKCLETFFKHIQYKPSHVVLIDDEIENLKRVKKVLKKYGVNFSGCRYGYLDEKVTRLDIHKAAVELSLLNDLLPNDAKIALEKLNIKIHKASSNETVLLKNSFFAMPSNQDEMNMLNDFDSQNFRKLNCVRRFC